MSGVLKRILSRFYITVKSCNFINFAKESEWKKKVRHFINQQKIDEIKFLFNHISSTITMDLFNKDDIEDYDTSKYEDSLLYNSSDS